MTASRTIDPTGLTALDVHVHLEAPKSGNPADAAAVKYFGDSGMPRDGAAVIELARANPDVIIPFASLDIWRPILGLIPCRSLSAWIEAFDRCMAARMA